MEKKRYRSYEQIDAELEILKIEKELNLQRIVLNVQRTKEIIMPKNILKAILGSYQTIFQGSSSTIIGFVTPIVINWIRNRKRG